MNTNSFTVWSGAQVPLRATQGDPESISASIVRIPQSGGPEVITTGPFETVEGDVVADLTFEAETVTEETIYDYYVTENFDTESPLIYPDPRNCTDGNCELPTITICPLGAETS